LSVKTLTPEENFSGRQKTLLSQNSVRNVSCQQVGPDVREQSISFEPSYVFKKLQMQDHHFTASELTQCVRHNGWICLWISTVTDCIHAEIAQLVAHTTSNTPTLICLIIFTKLKRN